MNLSIASLALLALLFFLTSAVGVVTGSNSLITVPAMFQFGIDPKVAIATNMFGLTFMAIGATVIRELLPVTTPTALVRKKSRASKAKLAIDKFIF